MLEKRRGEWNPHPQEKAAHEENGDFVGAVNPPRRTGPPQAGKPRNLISLPFCAQKEKRRPREACKKRHHFLQDCPLADEGGRGINGGVAAGSCF
jgi:hypothetical protein